mgnify:CR=1 FL=1
MAAIYKGTLGLIGNTPLVEPVNLEKELGLEATILVKLEYLNPAGKCERSCCEGNDRRCRRERNPERRFCYH